jgi:phage-related protein
MRRYQIETYREVKKFIDKLNDTRRARVDRFYSLFEEYGIQLPKRYFKKVAPRVWELRPGDIRLFLTLKKNRAFVVHAIYKKSQKIPKKDLKLAVRRIKELNLI